MNLKTEQLKKELKYVDDFFNQAKLGKSFHGPELREWIIRATTLFSVLKVEPHIVGLFLKGVSFKEEKEKHAHGAFVYGLKGYSLKPSILKTPRNNQDIIYLEIPLNIAKIAINNLEEEEKLIPSYIIKSLSYDKFQLLKISLELIEDKFQKKEWGDIMSPLVQALDQVLNLIPEKELQKENSAKAKLETIFVTKDLYTKYVADNKDIIWSLNNSRVIRNTIEHKKEEYGNLPISQLEVVGYVHLLLILLSTIFASGNVNVEEI